MKRNALADDGDSCVGWDFIKQEVAAYPASAPCLRAQRFAFLENCPCERETGNEKQIHHGPVFSFVVKNHQVRSVASLDGVKHGGVIGVEDATAKGMGLRFQLIWRVATRAHVVDGARAGQRWS